MQTLLLEIAHLLAMAIMLGVTVAAMVAARLAAGHTSGPASALMHALQIRLAQWGFLALAVLWITGSALLPEDVTALPRLFWGKMGAVVMMTAAAVALQVAIRRKDPALLEAHGALLRPVITLMSVAAMALAVVAAQMPGN